MDTKNLRFDVHKPLDEVPMIQYNYLQIIYYRPFINNLSSSSSSQQHQGGCQRG